MLATTIKTASLAQGLAECWQRHTTAGLPKARWREQWRGVGVVVVLVGGGGELKNPPSPPPRPLLKGSGLLVVVSVGGTSATEKTGPAWWWQRPGENVPAPPHQPTHPLTRVAFFFRHDKSHTIFTSMCKKIGHHLLHWCVQC